MLGRLSPGGATDTGALVVPPHGAYPDYVKPVLDRVAGAVLLLVASPMLLSTLVAARLFLGRRVLLRQPRVGKDGAVFSMYKVRTMEPDRRLRQVPFPGPDRRTVHKRPDDPRHTTFGRFLRKWSLDELPQLWNVVRGDMSLVGPRPELVAVVDRLGLWDHPRHWVRPGLTGPWQVSDLRRAPLHESVHVDVEYVSTVSFRRDLATLAGTVRALRHGHGS